jgi:hypothetical protein
MYNKYSSPRFWYRRGLKRTDLKVCIIVTLCQFLFIVTLPDIAKVSEPVQNTFRSNSLNNYRSKLEIYLKIQFLPRSKHRLSGV